MACKQQNRLTSLLVLSTLVCACLVVALVIPSSLATGGGRHYLFDGEGEDFVVVKDDYYAEDETPTPEEEEEFALYASLINDPEALDILFADESDDADPNGGQTQVDIRQQLRDLKERRDKERAEHPEKFAAAQAERHYLTRMKEHEERNEQEYEQEYDEDYAGEEEPTNDDGVEEDATEALLVASGATEEVAPASDQTDEVAPEPVAAEEPKEAVVPLTAASFDETLHKFPYTFVEFYAPWCGHCKKLAPELEAAAQQLTGQPGVLVAKIDCTAEEAICRRFDVRGYPTMKFFRHGKLLMDYELGRTASDVVAFIKKKSIPTTTALHSQKEVEDFLAAHPTSLIVYAAPNSDTLLGTRDTANQAVVEDFAFGEVSDADLISQLGEQTDTVKIFRSFAPDEPHVLVNGTPASILSAVLTYGFPCVDDGPDAWGRVVLRKVPIIVLFADMSGESVQDILSWFTELAQANIHRFSFLYAGKDFHSRLPSLGASGDVIPTIVAVDAETTKSWPFDESKEFNRENVEALLSGIADRTLRPHYTSEKPPADNTGDVLVVVGDTFEELVLNNDKDVLIQFHAPWCGHCKQMAPTWENVGKHFAADDNIVVAKIDAAVNDNPAVVVAGYPTIYLFPAGNKSNPVEYKGLTRHLEDFIKFAQENATTLKRSSVDEDEASDSHADDHDHDEL